MPMRSCLAAALLGVLALAPPAQAAKKDDTVRFAYDQVLENVDPYFNNLRLGVIVGQSVWDTLIYRDPATNEYKGQLATAWKWVDDKTLELELRQGVKFHNGDEFDADDVVATFNYVSDVANKSTNQQNVNWIAKAEKVDKYRVRILTRRNFPAAIEFLAGPLVIHPGKYYAKVGPKGMNEKPVGSGPYRIVEHVIGKTIRLERNKDYWKASPKPGGTIDKIEIRMVPDRQTQVAEMLAGGLDLIMNVPVEQAQQLKAVPHLDVKSGGTMRIVFIHFNAGENAPTAQLKDVRVRRAIAHAIDKKTIAEELVGEGVQVIDSVCYPTQVGCTAAGVPVYGYDPAKAKALLADAGFKDGLEIDFAGYRDRAQTEAMINYLRAVGIKANLKFMQYAAMRDQHRANKVGASHQTWGSYNINDASASISAYFKGTDDDMTKDPEVIALVTQGDNSTDLAVRKDAYRKALALIADRAYAVPLYALNTWWVMSRDLEFKPFPDELPRFWEMKWK